MKEDDIIRIVERVFNDSLYSYHIGAEPWISTHIGGKPEFFRELRKELEKLFNENNLSK